MNKYEDRIDRVASEFEQLRPRLHASQSTLSTDLDPLRLTKYEKRFEQAARTCEQLHQAHDSLLDRWDDGTESRTALQNEYGSHLARVDSY